jgi:hypothetical protein
MVLAHARSARDSRDGYSCLEPVVTLAFALVWREDARSAALEAVIAVA